MGNEKGRRPTADRRRQGQEAGAESNKTIFHMSFQISHLSFPAFCFLRLPTGDCRLPTADWRLPTGDWRLATGD